MEKPGLEPPPLLSPTKASLRLARHPATPVPGAGAGGDVQGQRGCDRWVCPVHAVRPGLLQSPVRPLDGWLPAGIPVLWWGGGHCLGAKSSGRGDGRPWHGAALTAGKHTGFSMQSLSWETLSPAPQTRGAQLHAEQHHGGLGSGGWLGGMRPCSGTAPAGREPLCRGTARLTPALRWGHSSPCCLVLRERGRGREGLW